MVAETLVYLGNPSMAGIKWQDLVDEGAAYQAGFDMQYTGVMYGNGTEKQAFYAVRDLWGNLTINTTVQSNGGTATFRGLAGNYTVTVNGYRPIELTVAENASNVFNPQLVPLSSSASTTAVSASSIESNNSVVQTTRPQGSASVYLLLAAAFVAVVVVTALHSRRAKRRAAS